MLLQSGEGRNCVIYRVSKLFRNVPIVSYLEMSPFCVWCFSLERALKRSPVVRAKRKCAFQRAALPSPGSEPVASCFDNSAATDDLALLSSPLSPWQRAESAERFFVPTPSAR